ncbi:MAG: pyrrolo-quinoline quinone, partial [Akkermansiaceae bacterium]|nr:pyrrolo-quinoline quinone [Akkermansiaceae bacterium]
EGQYMAGPGREPVEPGPTDADLLWVYDMRAGVGAFPHNITSSSVALVNGTIFASTSNGVDEEHDKRPAAEAPCL